MEWDGLQAKRQVNRMYCHSSASQNHEVHMRSIRNRETSEDKGWCRQNCVVVYLGQSGEMFTWVREHNKLQSPGVASKVVGFLLSGFKNKEGALLGNAAHAWAAQEKNSLHLMQEKNSRHLIQQYVARKKRGDTQI